MGSDLHMNPPVPPPLWQQVQYLQEQHANQTDAIKKLLAENKSLRAQLATNDQIVAEQQRKITELGNLLKVEDKNNGISA